MTTIMSTEREPHLDRSMDGSTVGRYCRWPAVIDEWLISRIDEDEGDATVQDVVRRILREARKADVRQQEVQAA